jgi:hypothetical protein
MIPPTRPAPPSLLTRWAAESYMSAAAAKLRNYVPRAAGFHDLKLSVRDVLRPLHTRPKGWLDPTASASP